MITPCLIKLFLISEFPVLIIFLSFFTSIIKNVSYYKVYHIGYTSKVHRLNKKKKITLQR